MGDLLRLVVLVSGAALAAGWLRLAVWSAVEWRQGRDEGHDRSRSAWKAVMFTAQLGMLAQVEAHHLLNWGEVPDLFLPLNLVLITACLVATWQLVHHPRRRTGPR